jgi:hypothetical protein
VLDRGARGRDADPPVLGVPRGDLDAVEEIGAALGEPTGGGEAAGACEQERDALFAGHRLREYAERGPEPARGTRRRQAGGLLAGLAQDRDGAEVAFAG